MVVETQTQAIATKSTIPQKETEDKEKIMEGTLMLIDCVKAQLEQKNIDEPLSSIYEYAQYVQEEYKLSPKEAKAYIYRETLKRFAHYMYIYQKKPEGTFLEFVKEKEMGKGRERLKSVVGLVERYQNLAKGIAHEITPLEKQLSRTMWSSVSRLLTYFQDGAVLFARLGAEQEKKVGGVINEHLVEEFIEGNRAAAITSAEDLKARVHAAQLLINMETWLNVPLGLNGKSMYGRLKGAFNQAAQMNMHIRAGHLVSTMNPYNAKGFDFFDKVGIDYFALIFYPNGSYKIHAVDAKGTNNTHGEQIDMHGEQFLVKTKRDGIKPEALVHYLQELHAFTENGNDIEAHNNNENNTLMFFSINPTAIPRTDVMVSPEKVRAYTCHIDLESFIEVKRGITETRRLNLYGPGQYFSLDPSFLLPGNFIEVKYFGG